MKRKLLLSTGLVAGIASLSTVIACGSTTQSSSGNTWANRKEIVIAVDGAQEDFYNEVIKEFNETSYAKEKGFKIQTINKNVFGALDFGTQGLTDEQVPDLFYAPNDRITSTAQTGSLAEIDEFDPTLFDELAKQLGVTSAEEIKEMRDFGTVEGVIKGDINAGTVKKLLALRHNAEGIVMASSENEDESRKILENANTDTLAELVTSGEALLRIQDFWFGNGIFGGVFDKLQKDKIENGEAADYLMSKILYSDNNEVKSGFIKSDKFHPEFKKALDVVGDLLWPIYEAAFKKNTVDYGQTVWGKKGISQADLVSFLGSDVGNAQNISFRLMKEGKIKFALVGTWDIQNAQSTANAKSFFNVVNTKDDYKYLQASGSWSYAINARNNGVSEDRKNAIVELIKIIFKTEPYLKYFERDSKIPFAKAERTRVQEAYNRVNTEKNAEVAKFATDLGFKNFEDLIVKYQEVVQPIVKLARSGLLGNTWSIETNSDPLNDANKLPKSTYQLLTKEEVKLKPEDQKGNYNVKPDQMSNEQFTTLNNSLEDSYALRNVLSAILGLTNLADLQGNNEPWQIGEGVIKGGLSTITNPKFSELMEGNNAWHVRKVEKYIFGANGDNGDEKEALIQSFSNVVNDETGLNDLINSVIQRAKDFSSEVAKTTVAADVIEKAVKGYLANFVNVAKVRNATAGIYAEGKMVNSDGQPSEVTFDEVTEKTAEYNKLKSVDKVLQVVASSRTIQEGGIGILSTQERRIDNSNPQFGQVWGNWNEKTVGNKVKLEEIKNSVNNKEQFVAAIEDHLSYLFGETAKSITGKASLTVAFDPKKPANN
ncbi:hypothetical protein [Mycoplasma sp. CSL7503-lung]|uniref:hypothetical protein n=1 Tax=Mycoplasma sp. CSL7503-lung TaxID=536372 RepID=UPI0021CE070B|nr:hypothetical protein [Mycoplasma sp. CSL7503-lung]MCU4706559.1 hypothetical protein [Mycoplasma sp. CSL7503-lung]